MSGRLFAPVLFATVVLLTLQSAGLAQQATPTPSSSPAPQLTKLPESILNAELKSARGASFRLSDYSGKVLVINLWATWLGPSRMEIPELVKLQKDYWSRGVRVVGLSTEDPTNSLREVREMVRDYRIQYKVGWASEDVSTTLLQGRDAIPQTYVVSRSGRIVRYFFGFNSQKYPAQWRDAVADALKEQ